MPFQDLLGPFLDTLRTQRLRTALTVLGITWGTTAVVVLLAFGVGLEKQMKTNAAGIGDGVVIVFPGRTTKSFAGFPEGRRIRLTADDAALVGREVSEIGIITAEFGRWNTPVRNGTNAANPYVSGVEPIFGELRNVSAAPGGRFLNELDMEGRRRVAFLGDELKKVLFGEETDAVGKTVFVGQTPFLVVGVMVPKNQNSSYSQRDKDRIFIPATTFRATFGVTFASQVLYRPADPSLGGDAEKRMRQVLSRKHTFDPGDEDALGVWDTNEGARFFKYLFLGFNLFLGVVGSFTLVVGGIGVANIMYVVVRERTREIGVRRALGARRSTILSQILLETFVIVAVGAVLGLLVSVALVKAASLIPMQDEVGTPTISTVVMGATMGLLAVIALLAGFFPARKAANLDPVECLRYAG